jgi:hypothetical protein
MKPALTGRKSYSLSSLTRPWLPYRRKMIMRIKFREEIKKMMMSSCLAQIRKSKRRRTDRLTPTTLKLFMRRRRRVF